MNYLNIYKLLILKGKNRLLESTAVETHHIVPKCLGGGDEPENLVTLTPEEHYLAHLLLTKIYPTESKVWYAANMMRSRVRNNKEYGWFKRAFIAQMKQDRKFQPRTQESIEKQKETIRQKYEMGYISPLAGTTISEEHKQKISKGNIGKKIPTRSRSSLEGYVIRYGEKEGRKRYKEDSKKKASNSLKSFIARFGEEEGKKRYTERKQKLSNERKGKNNPFYGKKHDDSTKERLKEIANNRPIVQCPHCDRKGIVNIMKRWHFDKCKQNKDQR